MAVLSGNAPLGPVAKRAEWPLVMHPDGYFGVTLPSGYSSTRVEIWVPQGSPRRERNSIRLRISQCLVTQRANVWIQSGPSATAH